MDHYETLGVPRDASQEEIKRAYRKKASEHHTDRPGGDKEKITAVVVAYQTLKDPERRERYDRTGQDGAAPTLEQKAQTFLMQAIDIALEQMPDDADIPKQLRESINGGLIENGRTLANMRKTISGVEKKMKRIRKKSSGDNLFTMPGEKKIADLRQSIERCEEHCNMLRLCLTMVDDYEAEPVVSPYDQFHMMPRRAFTSRGSLWDV